MEYLGYKHLYAKAAPRDEIPDFQERIPPDIALELCVVTLSILSSSDNPIVLWLQISWNVRLVFILKY